MRRRGIGYVTRQRIAVLAEKVVSPRHHDYALCGPIKALLLDLHDSDVIDIITITIVVTIVAVVFRRTCPGDPLFVASHPSR